MRWEYVVSTKVCLPNSMNQLIGMGHGNKRQSRSAAKLQQWQVIAAFMKSTTFDVCSDKCGIRRRPRERL